MSPRGCAPPRAWCCDTWPRTRSRRRAARSRRARSAREPRRQALDGGTRVEVEHALAEDPEGGVGELVLGNLGAGDLAQQRLDALDLGAHRVSDEALEIAGGIHRLVREDAAQRRRAIGADEALEHRVHTAPQARFGPACAPACADLGMLRGAPREIAHPGPVEAFLAAAAVPDRRDVGPRRVDNLSNACASKTVSGELLGCGRNEPAARLVLQLVRVGEHAFLPWILRTTVSNCCLNWDSPFPTRGCKGFLQRILHLDYRAQDQTFSLHFNELKLNCPRKPYLGPGFN